MTELCLLLLLPWLIRLGHVRALLLVLLRWSFWRLVGQCLSCRDRMRHRTAFLSSVCQHHRCVCALRTHAFTATCLPHSNSISLHSMDILQTYACFTLFSGQLMWPHILKDSQVAEPTRHSSCGCIVCMPRAKQPALAKTDVVCQVCMVQSSPPCGSIHSIGCCNVGFTHTQSRVYTQDMPDMHI